MVHKSFSWVDCKAYLGINYGLLWSRLVVYIFCFCLMLLTEYLWWLLVSLNIYKEQRQKIYTRSIKKNKKADTQSRSQSDESKAENALNGSSTSKAEQQVRKEKFSKKNWRNKQNVFTKWQLMSIRQACCSFRSMGVLLKTFSTTSIWHQRQTCNLIWMGGYI